MMDSSSEIRGGGGGSYNEEEIELRRGPWTVDEDVTLINHIATHGEGRWNSLARSAGTYFLLINLPVMHHLYIFFMQ